MPVYKYKTFDEAKLALWCREPDRAYFRQLNSLWALADRLSPIKYPPGVFKYRTIEEAYRQRGEWDLSSARKISSRGSKCQRGEISRNPMNPRDYRIASELKRRLAEAVEMIDFKVFGSKARGDDDEFSDLDVFIEVALLDRKTKDAISEIAWEIGLENSIVISPLVFSVDETENSPLRASPILLNIKEEGVRV